jgi:hypothetical protein
MAPGGRSAMSPFEFSCAGERLEALPSGALHWPARRLLAVADLHLEKGSSYAVNALKLLPRHDTRQTLSILAHLIEALKPETVVCLGDSFHDSGDIERLPRQVTLAELRANPALKKVKMLKNVRLLISAITDVEYLEILRMAGIVATTGILLP